VVPRDFQNSDIRLRRPTVCAFRKLLRSKILVVIMSPIPVRNYIEVSMPFVPIELEEYVTKFLANNPGNERSKVTARLKETLAEFKAGALCLRCSNLGSRFRGSGPCLLHMHHRRGRVPNTSLQPTRFGPLARA